MADVAIIGSGIAGLGCAWWLTECGHQVTVYAGGDQVGGHARTVLARTIQGSDVAVETAFSVYNERSYPNFDRLMKQLEVPVQRAPMSFGVSLYDGKIEYSGHSIFSLFTQKSLLVAPEHWRMIKDILRFNKQAPQILTQTNYNPTLLEYLEGNGYSDGFVSRYLAPLGAAVWSVAPALLMQCPAKHFIRLCQNNGLLQLHDRPHWLSITGGSQEYIKRLTAKFADRIVPQAATRVKRTKAGPLVESNGTYKAYDAVVLACTAADALSLLIDPSENEQAVLGAFRYEQNTAVLHQDDALMPLRGGAWSSWNYLSHPDGKAAMTYWMNNLLDIDDATPLFVTINPPSRPKAELTLSSYTFNQPVYDDVSLAAQTYVGHLQGQGGIWFCGAWTGYGLHEDGLTSGLTVAEYLTGQARPWTVTEVSNASYNVQPANLPADQTAAA